MIKKNIYFLFLIVLYLVLALFKINWLGLQFDEVLFANISRGIVDGSFISLRVWKIPIMTMQYMGALKAYLYYFIFKIFSVSVLTVRLPMIILTVFSLCLAYKLMNYYFNKKISLLTILLLVLNPTFVSLTVFDVGPNVIELFLKLLFFLMIIFYLDTKKKKWLFLSFLTLFIGVYNKLNFIWIVNSILFLILITSKDLISKLRKYYFFVLLPFILFLFFFIKNNYWAEIGLGNFFSRIFGISSSFGELIKGNIFSNYLGVKSGDLFGNVILIFWCFIVFTGLILNIIQSKKDKKYFFVLCFVLLMMLQMILTKSAGAPWHIFMVEPFLTLLLVISLDFIPMKMFLKNFIIIILLTYGLWNNYQWFFGGKQNYSSVMWSVSNNDLCVYTKNQKYHFVSLNWGLHNQLILFDPIKNKYEEIWAQILGKWGNSITNDQKNMLLNNKNIRYITYVQKDIDSVLLSARDEWFDYAKSMGKKIYIEKEFFDKNGSTIAVYRIE